MRRWRYRLTGPFDSGDEQGKNTVFGADSFVADVRRADGKHISLKINVDVVDDMPLAVGGETSANEQGYANGALCLDFGADGRGGFRVNGVNITGNTLITGEFGSLTIDADGVWHYKGDRAGVENFEITLTDGDGDIVNGILQITVPEAAPDPVEPPDPPEEPFDGYVGASAYEAGIKNGDRAELTLPENSRIVEILENGAHGHLEWDGSKWVYTLAESILHPLGADEKPDGDKIHVLLEDAGGQHEMDLYINIVDDKPTELWPYHEKSFIREGVKGTDAPMEKSGTVAVSRADENDPYAGSKEHQTFDGGADGGSFEWLNAVDGRIYGKYGYLEGKADGTWHYTGYHSFVKELGRDEEVSEKFTYRFVDADGDFIENELEIVIGGQDAIMETDKITNFIFDEKTLPFGSEPNPEANVKRGTMEFYSPDGVGAIRIPHDGKWEDVPLNGEKISIDNAAGSMTFWFDGFDDKTGKYILSYEYNFMKPLGSHSLDTYYNDIYAVRIYGKPAFENGNGVFGQDYVDNEISIAYKDDKPTMPTTRIVHDLYAGTGNIFVSGDATQYFNLGADGYYDIFLNPDNNWNHFSWIPDIGNGNGLYVYLEPYGTFQYDGNGNYSFTLDDTLDSVRAIAKGETVTLTLIYNFNDVDNGLDDAFGYVDFVIHGADWGIEHVVSPSHIAAYDPNAFVDADKWNWDASAVWPNQRPDENPYLPGHPDDPDRPADNETENSEPKPGDRVNWGVDNEGFAIARVFESGLADGSEAGCRNAKAYGILNFRAEHTINDPILPYLGIEFTFDGKTYQYTPGMTIDLGFGVFMAQIGPADYDFILKDLAPDSYEYWNEERHWLGLNYEFRLKDNIDHDALQGFNDAKYQIGVHAWNNSGTAIDTHITLQVIDDVPIIQPFWDAAEKVDSGGVVATGLEFSYGADNGPGKHIEITLNGQTYAVTEVMLLAGYEIRGEHGTLKIVAEEDWGASLYYRADKLKAGEEQASDTFSFAVFDSDGDRTDTGTDGKPCEITFNVLPAPDVPVIKGTTYYYTEDGLCRGSLDFKYGADDGAEKHVEVSINGKTFAVTEQMMLDGCEVRGEHGVLQFVKDGFGDFMYMPDGVEFVYKPDLPGVKETFSFAVVDSNGDRASTLEDGTPCEMTFSAIGYVPEISDFYAVSNDDGSYYGGLAFTYGLDNGADRHIEVSVNGQTYEITEDMLLRDYEIQTENGTLELNFYQYDAGIQRGSFNFTYKGAGDTFSFAIVDSTGDRASILEDGSDCQITFPLPNLLDSMLAADENISLTSLLADAEPGQSAIFCLEGQTATGSLCVRDIAVKTANGFLDIQDDTEIALDMGTLTINQDGKWTFEAEKSGQQTISLKIDGHETSLTITGIAETETATWQDAPEISYDNADILICDSLDDIQQMLNQQNAETV